MRAERGMGWSIVSRAASINYATESCGRILCAIYRSPLRRVAIWDETKEWIYAFAVGPLFRGSAKFIPAPCLPPSAQVLKQDGQAETVLG